jgi:hypothetical protein
VIALLEAADLIMEATDHRMASTGAYRFVTPSGEALGSIQEVLSVSRSLGRFMSHRPGFGPARLQVVDADGNAILDIDKKRLRALGTLDVRVSLADGTALGSADGRVKLRRLVIALRNPAGVVLAELRGGASSQYELVDAHGDAMGKLARQLPTQATAPWPRDVWRSYKISFSPSAGIAVRALAFAALVSLDLRLL